MMKTIEYRGGLLSFRVPHHWIEEQEDDGSGVFYQMGLDTGVLRVAVLTFPPPFPSKLPSAYELVRSRAAKRGGTATELPNGNALLRYGYEYVEAGKEITQYYWDVANVVPPEHCLVAMFSYTVLKSQVEEPGIVEEIAMLHTEISNCHFAAGSGN
jgi:hypothetical protein